MYPINDLIRLAKSAYCNTHQKFDADWTQEFSGKGPSNLEKFFTGLDKHDIPKKLINFINLIEEEKIESNFTENPLIIWETIWLWLYMYPDSSFFEKMCWKQFEPDLDVIIHFFHEPKSLFNQSHLGLISGNKQLFL